MGTFTVTGRSSMAGGQPEDVSQVLANFDLLAAILNGNIDNANLAAGILASKLAGYPADIAQVLRGDGSWAGGVTRLAHQSAVAAFAFNAIPATFKHLLVVGTISSAVGAGGTDTPLVRFNGDTVGPYDTATLLGNGAAASSGGAAGTGFMTPITGMPSSANAEGFFMGFIPNYATALFHPSVWLSYTSLAAGAVGTIMIAGGLWRPAVSAAISSIGINGNGFAFTAGPATTASLYGLG